MASLSARDRTKNLEQLQSEEYDLLVIGGGITGAGILLDAVARGLKAALVEKRDFAWGTSSRSTKLIHGGLRYLKQFEFGLVREVGRERATVHKIARHIVRPEPILLPFYENGSMSKHMGALGLWMYDYMAGVKRQERRKMLSVEETLQTEPLLDRDGLKGGGLYYEYRTDDARLTIENIKTAVRKGAIALNYLEVEEFIYRGEKVAGVKCIDHIDGQRIETRAKSIINATGPWVDEVREKDREHFERKLFLTNGLHIVVPAVKFPLKQSMYFELDDGRMIFCIVRGGFVYIGTTDIAFDGDIDEPKVTAEESEYLLRGVNNKFPDIELTESDIVSTWAGLRPLIYQDGKSPSELSRKDEIFISDTGLMSIAGGKLTGYRKMAERIVDMVEKKLRGGVSRSTTDKIMLSGCDFTSEDAMAKHRTDLEERGMAMGIDRQVIGLMFSRYGSETGVILKRARQLIDQGDEADKAITRAELDYTVEQEMVHTPEDFFLRRTAMEHFEIERMGAIKSFVESQLTSIPSPRVQGAG